MEVSIKQSKMYDNIIFKNYNKEKFNKILPFLLKKKSPLRIVDLAGGEGQFYSLLKNEMNNIDYYLTDISNKQIKLAKKKGIIAKKMDLAKKFDYEDNFFDVVIISEIIEHIFDTKFFLTECNRILKKKGLLILTTPNVASLGNRFGLLFGKRPGCIEYRVEKSSGHIRAFIKSELEELIIESKFKILNSTGERVSLPLINKNKRWFKFNYYLGDIFPTLSNGFIIIAKKSEN